MRIILKLKCLQNTSRKDFELKYRSAFQAFLYSILNKSQFENVNSLHDSNKRGAFSFSSIMTAKGEPAKEPNLKQDASYEIVISTPFNEIAMSLVFGLGNMEQSGSKINLGIAQFSMSGISTFPTSISQGDIFKGLVVLKNKNNQYVVSKKDVKNTQYADLNEYSKFFNNSLSAKAKSLFGNETGNDFSEYLEIWPNGEDPVKIIPVDIGNVKPYIFIGNQVSVKVKPNADDEICKKLCQLFDAGVGTGSTYGFGYLHK